MPSAQLITKDLNAQHNLAEERSVLPEMGILGGRCRVMKVLS